MDKGGVAEYRRELLAGLSGRVIEVGAGDGGNFAHYPADVISVLALEPEPYLGRKAERRAKSAPVPVDVAAGVAEQIPTGDGSFDADVVSLVLCSVTDQRLALRECTASSGQVGSCDSSSMSAATDARFNWPSVSSTPPYGRHCSAAATRPATPQQPSRSRASGSIGSTGYGSPTYGSAVPRQCTFSESRRDARPGDVQRQTCRPAQANCAAALSRRSGRRRSRPATSTGSRSRSPSRPASSHR